MTLENLQDLYLEEIKDVYDAEHQLLKALESLSAAAKNPMLAGAFKEHHSQTQGQIKRLETVFRNLGEKPERKTCKAMQGLVKEGKEMIEEDADDDVKDAGLIAAAQRSEHYEIAAYGTVAAYAKLLGRKEDAKLLQATLAEEKETDAKLTKLAMQVANPAATDGGSAGSKAPSGGNLDEMSKEELYEMAQEKDIAGRSKMSREELVKALRK